MSAAPTSGFDAPDVHRELLIVYINKLKRVCVYIYI